MFRCVTFGIFAVFVASGCESSKPGAENTESIVRVQGALAKAFESSTDLVDVIIKFREPSVTNAAAKKEAFRELGDKLVARHGEGMSVRRRFMHVPAIAARISRDAFERLQNDPDVEYIQLDGKGSGALKEAVPAIGGDLVKKNHNLTGKGVRVAVLDTGVVTKHPDLSDSIVGQHCFTQFDCPPSRAAEGTSAEDDHGHGSNVAGIIASNGVVAPVGFAPGAELVAVKINDQNDSGQLSDWVAGLDWIYDNLATLKVKVINMSICSTALYSDAAQCDREEPAMAAAIKNLADAGVTMFAASGNLGMTNQMSSPACNTGVVAVAATYDSNVGAQPSSGMTYMMQYGSGVANCSDSTTAFDKITCFSNTSSRLDLVAPGCPMDSDGLNNGKSTYRGTSQASPVAAGVAALMLECNPKLTPTEIKKYMTSTGEKQVDPKNNLSFPSLRALTAVEAACYSGSSGAAGAAGGNLGSSGSSGGQAGAAGGKTGASGRGGSVVTGTAGQGTGGTVAITPTVPIASGAAGLATTSQPLTGGAAGAFYPISGTGTGAGAQDGCGCSVPGASHRYPSAISLALLVFALSILRRRARLCE
jgi:MYXO-CTERM domain-containing protein